MPPVGDAHTAGIARDTAAGRRTRAAAPSASFRFIPRELATKCRRLIESYHAIYGYVGLPDMLWLSDARDIIERDRELTRIFKRAARSRAAKRSQRFVSAHREPRSCRSRSWRATSPVGANAFPAAKGEAEKILGPAAATAAHLADGSLLSFRRSASVASSAIPCFLPHRNAHVSAAPRCYSGSARTTVGF